MELSPEEKKQMEDMFKGLRVAFKITAPFEVVEHNAHRKEGNTLDLGVRPEVASRR